MSFFNKFTKKIPLQDNEYLKAKNDLLGSIEFYRRAILKTCGARYLYESNTFFATHIGDDRGYYSVWVSRDLITCLIMFIEMDRSLPHIIDELSGFSISKELMLDRDNLLKEIEIFNNKYHNSKVKAEEFIESFLSKKISDFNIFIDEERSDFIQTLSNNLYFEIFELNQNFTKYFIEEKGYISFSNLYFDEEFVNLIEEYVLNEFVDNALISFGLIYQLTDPSQDTFDRCHAYSILAPLYAQADAIRMCQRQLNEQGLISELYELAEKGFLFNLSGLFSCCDWYRDIIDEIITSNNLPSRKETGYKDEEALDETIEVLNKIFENFDDEYCIDYDYDEEDRIIFDSETESEEEEDDELENEIVASHHQTPEPPQTKTSSAIQSFFNSNAPMIINKLKSSGIQLGAVALQNDENIARVANVVYNLLPSPVRFFVSFNTVEKFLLENRQWLINKLQ